MPFRPPVGARNLTKTPDLREDSLLDCTGRAAIALSTKRSNEGEVNLAVMDIASGAV